MLADFNTGYIERVIAVTGKDLFPPRPFAIPTWNYPEHYGYTSEEVSAVWESIKQDRHFWRKLPPYSETIDVVTSLGYMAMQDDVYFITARPGVATKEQTENWLLHYARMTSGYFSPTVLISSRKGDCAKALNLDVYLDDRRENCDDVFDNYPSTQAYILDQPWNQNGVDRYPRVTSVREFLACISS